MRGTELMRIAAVGGTHDVVVQVDGEPESGQVLLVLDHHANGTAEAAVLDFEAMLFIVRSSERRERRGRGGTCTPSSRGRVTEVYRRP